jgi:hypothetical protein
MVSVRVVDRRSRGAPFSYGRVKRGVRREFQAARERLEGRVKEINEQLRTARLGIQERRKLIQERSGLLKTPAALRARGRQELIQFRQNLRQLSAADKEAVQKLKDLERTQSDINQQIARAREQLGKEAERKALQKSLKDARARAVSLQKMLERKLLKNFEQAYGEELQMSIAFSPAQTASIKKQIRNQLDKGVTNVNVEIPKVQVSQAKVQTLDARKLRSVIKDEGKVPPLRISKYEGRNVLEILKSAPFNPVQENVKALKQELEEEVVDPMLRVLNAPSEAYAKRREAAEKILAGVGEQEFFGGKQPSELLPYQLKGTAEVTNLRLLSDKELEKLSFGGIDELIRRTKNELDFNSKQVIEKNAKENIPEFQKKLDEQYKAVYNDLQDKVNGGDIAPEAANSILNKKGGDIIKKLEKELNQEILKDSKGELGILEKNAQNYIKMVSKNQANKRALILAPINFVAGAALTFGLGSIGIVGRVLGGALTAGVTLEAPGQIRQFVSGEGKLATAIETGSFLAGGILGAGLASAKVRGRIKKVGKAKISSLNTVIKENVKAFAESQKRFLRNKKASTFSEASQILKKKRKKKKTRLGKEQIEEFKEVKFKQRSRSEQVNLVKKILNTKTELSELEKINRLKKFLRESGLNEIQVTDRILEAMRQIAAIRLRKEISELKKTGFTKGELASLRQQMKRLKDGKNQILSMTKARLKARLPIEGGVSKGVPSLDETGQFVSLTGTARAPSLTKAKRIPSLEVEKPKLSPLSQKYKQRARLSLGEKYKLAQRGRVSLAQRSRARLAQRSKVALAFAQPQRSSLAERMAQRERQLQKEKRVFKKPPLLVEKKALPKDRLRRDTKLRSYRERLREPRRQLKPKKKKIPVLIPFGSRGRMREKVFPSPPKKQGYNVFVRSRGKFNKVNKNPLVKGHAASLGAYVVDQSLAATFKIKKANKPAAKSEFRFPKNYAKRTINKFRPGKKNKSWIVEKRGRRLDTLREVRKIQAARLLSQMRRKPSSAPRLRARSLIFNKT